ncbi:MAG: imidazole glycerol phosphate synthase subunit HisH [Clostridia bacterium]|nr:imidazole glycerol phosphate synthase subunit HisH [Clostridia bacterium]
MVAIVDYGVGNLFSLSGSFAFIGQKVCITSDPETLRRADHIVLPGVGAFSDAIAKLEESGLIPVLKEEVKKGKPFLGICLGMQLLFDESHEYGVHKGLGLVPGKVLPIADVIPKDYKIPHIGWNALSFPKPSYIFRYLKEGDFVYFVHSFYGAECEASVTATTEYGASLTAAVQNGNVYGCQFHPEKSGEVGLKILKAFCELEGSTC